MNNPQREVVITGIGPVSSAGVGVDAFWSSLSAGRCNVTRREMLVDAGVTESLPMAAMPATPQVPGLDRHFDFLDKQECAAHRDLAYAMLATELALRDANLQYDRDDNTLGAVQVFEAPGVEQTVLELFRMMSTPPSAAGPPPTYNLLAPHFYNTQPFVYVHLLGKAFGLHGFSTSVHNACSSGALAIEIAARHIRSGQADVCLVVGGEAFETAVRLEWFRRLELYATDENMRPFDRQPTGFYVGEGAAALVLESDESASSRGANVYATYAGGAFAQQSWKQTVPDVRTARLSGVIERAMHATGMKPADIDLVVPHGAAGRVSDGYEVDCLNRALDPAQTGAVATAIKPYTGHMLAGSVLIESAGALLAMRHNHIPATPNTQPDRVDLALPLICKGQDRKVKTVLKLATGFTGHDAALIFRKD